MKISGLSWERIGDQDLWMVFTDGISLSVARCPRGWRWQALHDGQSTTSDPFPKRNDAMKAAARWNSERVGA